MNWTGGQRQRHSNAPNSLKLRQQQHFAKVRATLLSGKKRSSPKHPNIDRLQALYEGNRQPSEPRGPILQNQNSFGLQNSRNSLESRQASYSEDSQQLPDYAPQQHAASASLRLGRELDQNLDDSTPQPRMKRERDISPLLQDGGMAIEVEESLLEKRRKILRKGDWVSVGFQRAPRLEFPSRKEERQFAKRRRLTDDHRPRYIKKIRDSRASPVIGIYQPPSFEDVNGSKQKHRLSNVKISIGGKTIPPGISSSSAPNKKNSHSSEGARSSRRASKSSDIMLLDNLERTPVESRVAAGIYGREYANSGSARQPSLGQSHVPPSSNIGSPASHRGREIQQTPQPKYTSSSGSLSLHHPKPQSSKVSSILRSTSTSMAESTAANLGRLKLGNSASQLGKSDIWEAWMDSMLPNHIFDKSDIITGGSVDDHKRTISPGISVLSTNGLVNDRVMECGTPSETNFCIQDSPQFEISDMEEEEEGMEGLGDMETPYLEAESDILDDISADNDNVELLTQREKSISESLDDFSPVPQDTFKILSPIPELGAGEHLDELPKDSHCSPTSISSKRSNRPETSSPSYSQHDQFRTSMQGFSEIVPTRSQTNFPQASKTLPNAPVKAQPTEDASREEIWRKFVFGNDSEETDMFRDDASGLDMTHSMEQSKIPRSSLDNSILLTNSIKETPTETDVMFSSNSYQSSTSSFISQLTNDVSQDRRCGEVDSMVLGSLADFHSTAGNATSVDASSCYSLSLDSSSSLATGVAPTNVAERGSTIHSLNDTPPSRPRRKVMFTKPTRLNAGVSTSETVKRYYR